MTAASAIRQAFEGLDPLEREQVSDERYYGPQNFASRFGFNVDEVRSVIRELSAPVPESGAANTKHDWLTRIASRTDLTLLEVRAAIVLWQYTNAGTGLAWPSQTTVAQAMGVSSERKARQALSGLQAKGVIARTRISDLDEEQRDAIRRHGRGTCYSLRTPAESPKKASPEPQHLRETRSQNPGTETKSAEGQ